MHLLLLSLFPFLFLLPFISAQSPNPSPEPLLSILTPSFAFPSNEAATALFPPASGNLETALFVRLTLLFALSRYEIIAACDTTALSFFGVKDPIAPHLCHPLSRIIITSYINLRLNQQNFPAFAPSYSTFLAEQGLTPFNDSTDPNTEIGWANRVSKRANDYFATDGWNALGDLTRNKFRRPYFDQTGYKPQNLAGIPVDKLPRPLRWQPLTTSMQTFGSYQSQVHIVPQLSVVEPFALSDNDLLKRKTKNPYRFPNSKQISRADMNKLGNLMDEYFKVSRQLTAEQRFSAFWWDNKGLSLGIFRPILSRGLGLTEAQDVFLRMAELVAQSDALTLTWREKLRHDLVRPVTIIQRLKAGKKVRAFINEDIGVAEVDGGDFESMVQTQPHSEFPSASAVLCRASFECIEMGYKKIIGKDVEIPRLVSPALPGSFPGIPIREQILLNFSLGEAISDCAQSRLYAGAHFSPSIKIGDRIGRGVGRKAFKHMFELFHGRVPETCGRCVRK